MKNFIKMNSCKVALEHEIDFIKDFLSFLFAIPKKLQGFSSLYFLIY
jgi:hypothetical protein